MSELNVQTYEQIPARFEAGPFPVAKAAKEAAEDIPAHAPVALNGEGKLALLTATTAEDVTTVDAAGLYGVTPEAIEAGKTGPVYLTGEFFADSLVLPDGAAAADVEIPLRAIGIFLK